MTADEAKARCWVEVDLDAVCDNYIKARDAAGDADVIPVLKADAYGCGAAKVAGALKRRGARLAAVATVTEALEIKGILDVLVLGLAGDSLIETAIKENIILTAYSPESARAYAYASQKLGKTCRVHIKVNTGLNRLGFDPQDEASLIMAAEDPRLLVEGIYTHLGLHDEASDLCQFELFDRAYKAVNAPLRHVLDSIGLFKYPDRRYDAVRVGAYLYGVSPSSAFEPAKPAVAFRA
ncbi:MAG: alanine racemase, partial [Clostridia bacterium]|nr:alanine racemase [Clostridia bacterium]